MVEISLKVAKTNIARTCDITAEGAAKEASLISHTNPVTATKSACFTYPAKAKNTIAGNILRDHFITTFIFRLQVIIVCSFHFHHSILY